MKISNFQRIVKLVSICTLLSFASVAQAAFILSFDSSPNSWVGQGQSFTVTPDDGYIFSVNENVYWDNSQHFLIASLNSPFGPDWDPLSGSEYHYWTLDLSAPFGGLLGIGRYENAARWPFNDIDQPGLTFSGDHRGNNTNSGFFDILDIQYNDLGILDVLAVDFTQYGEANPDWWIHGSLRFNSSIPLQVSEPSAFLLMIIGMLSLMLISAKARRSRRF